MTEAKNIRPVEPPAPAAPAYAEAMSRLVGVVQDLSHAHDMAGIMEVVRKAARELTGADGATFVLRDDDKCFYAEENAISPLWKGQRFPLKSCISGWAMLNRQPAVIEDIYKDPRIPADAYRPTFVKSLAMVPIRREDPLGAIGNYWATMRMPTAEEVALLQALADVTSVAIENAELTRKLEEKVRALSESNRELSRFAWVTSHDLKSPLRAIHNLSQWVEEDTKDALPEAAKERLRKLRQRVHRMEHLLDDILEYAHAHEGGGPAMGRMVEGGEFVRAVLDLVSVPQGFTVAFDPAIHALRLPLLPLQRVFTNLIDNAIKHHDRKEGRIEVGVKEDGAHYVFTVRDDGPGIPPQYHAQIFEMLQTLKPRDQVEGSGIGLAMVKKLLANYGCDIRVESGPGRGTAFIFTWTIPLNLPEDNS